MNDETTKSIDAIYLRYYEDPTKNDQPYIKGYIQVYINVNDQFKVGQIIEGHDSANQIICVSYINGEYFIHNTEGPALILCDNTCSFFVLGKSYLIEDLPNVDPILKMVLKLKYSLIIRQDTAYYYYEYQ